MSKVNFASVRHLLLHFDLNTQQGDRGDAYKAIEGISKPVKPVRLTGSVFLVPLPDGVSHTSFLYGFWSALATATRGHLVKGDVFYLHVASGQGGYMDVLYQAVDASGTLDPKPEGTVLEALFLDR